MPVRRTAYSPPRELTLSDAVDVLRALATEHCVDEFGMLRPGSTSLQGVVWALGLAGELETVERLEPYSGQGQIVNQQLALKPRSA